VQDISSEAGKRPPRKNLGIEVLAWLAVGWINRAAPGRPKWPWPDTHWARDQGGLVAAISDVSKLDFLETP
jgi:hypothetical protein